MFCKKIPVRLNHTANGLSTAVFGTKIRFNLHFIRSYFRNGQEEGQTELLVGYSGLRCGNVNVEITGSKTVRGPVFSVLFCII